MSFDAASIIQLRVTDTWMWRLCLHRWPWHLDQPDYGTVQLELIEKANLAAQRARCDTDPYPAWKTVDKNIPILPQSGMYVGSFALEYQQYLSENHDGEEDVEGSLPDLIVPSTPSQSAPRPQSMTRSTDDVDEEEFLREVASGGDDDEEEVEDELNLLSELAQMVPGDDMAAVAKLHRSRLNPSADPPPIPSYSRGTGDMFLKMKGAGCRVYPIENPEEIALANQLVLKHGEDHRTIAMEMNKAGHDKVLNASGHLRTKSPAVVSRWLAQREQQRRGLTLLPFSFTFTQHLCGIKLSGVSYKTAQYKLKSITSVRP
jgi:hypothetical protein